MLCAGWKEGEVVVVEKTVRGCTQIDVGDGKKCSRGIYRSATSKVDS